MRRGILLAAGLIAVCMALPGIQPAQARDPVGGLIGTFTSPLNSLFGGRRYVRHRYSRRDRSVSRRHTRTRTVITAPVPAAEVQPAQAADSGHRCGRASGHRRRGASVSAGTGSIQSAHERKKRPSS
jgi:hypothetical protein